MRSGRRRHKAATSEHTEPVRHRGFFRDVRDFLLHRPPTPTLVDQSTPERQEYLSQSIMQRLGIDVTTYSVLNIHRIGIDVPCRFLEHRYFDLEDVAGQEAYLETT